MSRAGPGSQDDSACRDELQREVTPDVTNRTSPNEKSIERTQSNSNRSIVFRLVRQPNIIEQELFGEFDCRTREFDFRT